MPVFPLVFVVLLFYIFHLFFIFFKFCDPVSSLQSSLESRDVLFYISPVINFLKIQISYLVLSAEQTFLKELLVPNGYKGNDFCSGDKYIALFHQ